MMSSLFNKKKKLNIFDSVNEVSDRGIIFKNKKILRSIKVMPEDLAKMPNSEQVQILSQFSYVYSNNARYKLFITPILPNTDLDDYVNRIENIYINTDDEVKLGLAEKAIMKANEFSYMFRDVIFIISLIGNERHIDDELKKLSRDFGTRIKCSECDKKDYLKLLNSSFFIGNSQDNLNMYFPDDNDNITATNVKHKSLLKSYSPSIVQFNKRNFKVNELYSKTLLLRRTPSQFPIQELSQFIRSDIRLQMILENSYLDLAKVMQAEKRQNNKLLDKYTKENNELLRKKTIDQIEKIDEFLDLLTKRNDKCLKLTMAITLSNYDDEMLDKEFEELKNRLSLRDYLYIDSPDNYFSFYAFTNPILMMNEKIMGKISKDNASFPVSSFNYAIMHPYRFEEVTDKYGFLLGVTAQGGKFVFDPMAYYNGSGSVGNRTNNNGMIIGESGGGKSTDITLIVEHNRLSGVRSIWIDPDKSTQKDVVKVNDGVYFTFDNRELRINLFDLLPNTTDDDELSEEELERIKWDTEYAIEENIDKAKNTIKLYSDTIDENSLNLVGVSVKLLYELKGFPANFKGTKKEDMPIFSEFYEINQIMSKWREYKEYLKRTENGNLNEDELQQRNMLELIDNILEEKVPHFVSSEETETAFKSLNMKIFPMLNEHKRYFDGHSTIDTKSIMNEPIIAFNLKSLMDKGVESLTYPLTYLFLSYSFSFAIEDDVPSMLLIDEAHRLIKPIQSISEQGERKQNIIRDYINQMYRRARKYKAGIVVATQEPEDLGAEAVTITNQSTWTIIKKLTKNNALDSVDKLIGISEFERNTIKNFEDKSGESLFLLGNHRLFCRTVITDYEKNLIKATSGNKDSD